MIASRAETNYHLSRKPGKMTTLFLQTIFGSSFLISSAHSQAGLTWKTPQCSMSRLVTVDTFLRCLVVHTMGGSRNKKLYHQGMAAMETPFRDGHTCNLLPWSHHPSKLLAGPKATDRVVARGALIPIFPPSRESCSEQIGVPI